VTSYHFVGVGGIGMSAIARILLARGESVSGSDLSLTPLVGRLRDEGVRIFVGHDAGNVAGAETVVVSSAIARRNPECIAAAKLGIPVLHRGEMLARLLDGRRGIAICGTHGKTTTTAMTHAVLRRGGIDASLVLGGIDVALDTNAHDGRAEWFVTEADESDGSFVLLAPQIAVVTNVENDHLTSDEELPGLVRAFAEFLAKLPDDGVAIVGVDNALAASLQSHDLRARVVTYGLAAEASVRAQRLRFDGLGSRFDVTVGGANIGEVRLRVPGEMNVQNALGAVAVGLQLGLPFEAIAGALGDFAGVRRRFDVLVSSPRAVVVDDYAHHPTAVRATIVAARRCHRGPLVVAFQPHRYSRTAYLAREFAAALREADRVYLTPVYAASEPVIPGVSERSIGDALAALGGDVRYAASMDELENELLERSPRGAIILMLGAGDITDAAARLAARIESGERAAPLPA
jgi:UDP-N-acetylmuramate--alanine ligase